MPDKVRAKTEREAGGPPRGITRGDHNRHKGEILAVRVWGALLCLLAGTTLLLQGIGIPTRLADLRQAFEGEALLSLGLGLGCLAMIGPLLSRRALEGWLRLTRLWFRLWHGAAGSVKWQAYGEAAWQQWTLAAAAASQLAQAVRGALRPELEGWKPAAPVVPVGPVVPVRQPAGHRQGRGRRTPRGGEGSAGEDSSDEDGGDGAEPSAITTPFSGGGLKRATAGASRGRDPTSLPQGGGRSAGFFVALAPGGPARGEGGCAMKIVGRTVLVGAVLLYAAAAALSLPLALAAETGSAIEIEGLNKLTGTVQKYAGGALGKAVGIGLAIGGLGLITGGRIGQGTVAAASGVGMAFVPGMVNTAFQSAGGVVALRPTIWSDLMFPGADPVLWASLGLVLGGRRLLTRRRTSLSSVDAVSPEHR